MGKTKYAKLECTGGCKKVIKDTVMANSEEEFESRKLIMAMENGYRQNTHRPYDTRISTKNTYSYTCPECCEKEYKGLEEMEENMKVLTDKMGITFVGEPWADVRTGIMVKYKAYSVNEQHGNQGSSPITFFKEEYAEAYRHLLIVGGNDMIAYGDNKVSDVRVGENYMSAYRAKELVKQINDGGIL